MPSNQLMPLKAACGYLGGVSQSYIEKLYREKKLAVVRIGRRVMFRHQDLDAFVRERLQAAK